MEKYQLLPEQLMREGTVEKEQFFVPEPSSEEHILLTHTEAYWQKLKTVSLPRKEERPIGFPVSEQLVLRERIINQGTLDCAHFALEHGAAANIAGGTHHAYADRGEGFCLLNDHAMAANVLLQQEVVQRILIVDLDVHQGNGTAVLFKDEPRVFTFSMHGANNYPLRKEQSDLDVPLPDNTGDTDYLRQLQLHLPQLLAQHKPQLVFYQSGVDVLATDKLGRLGMSLAGCKQRDIFVLESLKAAGVPVVITMGGGYSQQLAHILEAHANTFRVAKDVYF
jgi:acetoin utilization deacetylase AcuC-like enzyme